MIPSWLTRIALRLESRNVTSQFVPSNPKDGEEPTAETTNPSFSEGPSRSEPVLLILIA